MLEKTRARYALKVTSVAFLGKTELVVAALICPHQLLRKRGPEGMTFEDPNGFIFNGQTIEFNGQVIHRDQSGTVSSKRFKRNIKAMDDALEKYVSRVGRRRVLELIIPFSSLGFVNFEESTLIGMNSMGIELISGEGKQFI